MLITGFEGPITIASASRVRRQHLGARLGRPRSPPARPPCHLGPAAVEDQVLLQVARARRRSPPWSAPAESLIGSTRALDPERRRDLRLGVGRRPALRP